MTQLGQLVAQGRTSVVYAYGPHAVVKVSRPHVPSTWAGLEATLTQAVHEEGLPTPEVLDVVTIHGREAVVFERIHGPSMWQCMLDRPAEAAAMARQMADVHLQIHGANVPAALPNLRSRVLKNIHAVARLSVEQRTHAAAALLALPQRRALCHGDLHPGNILMSSKGPVVIDWFDAAAGDALADTVRTSLLMRPPTQDPVVMAHLPHAKRELLDRVHLAYLRRIFQRDCPDDPQLRPWEAVLAVGRLAERAQINDADLVDVWESFRAGSAEETPLTAVMRQVRSGSLLPASDPAAGPRTPVDATPEELPDQALR